MRSCAATLLLLAAAIPLTAETVALDFEGLPDGTILTTQYPGVTFSNAIILTAGISLNEFEFPPHSGLNVSSDDGAPMSVVFAGTVLTFSGYFTYADSLTLDAFNNTGALVASSTSAFSDNEKLSGNPGSNPNEYIQVSSTDGISSVTITGALAGGSFAMDDATYATGGTTVPEPTTLFTSAAVLGLLCLGATKRKLTS